MLGTVSKAARVLELFSEDGRAELGVSEVARELGLPKSSAHSLMATLAQAGLLARTPEHRYRLGWRILPLGRRLLDGSAVRAQARPTLELLVERYRLTSHLAVLDDGVVIYLDKMQPHEGQQVTLSRVGRRVPAHCTALGKVLLAGESWDRVQAMAQGHELRRYTEHTLGTLVELRTELDLVRRHGFACAAEEIIPGVACVAAPIADGARSTLAAVSITLPADTYRRQPDHYARLVAGAARRVTRSLALVERNLDDPIRDT